MMENKFIVAVATISLLTHCETGHAQGDPDKNSSGNSARIARETLRESHDEKEVLSPDTIVQNNISGPVRVEFVVESLFRFTGASTEKDVPMNFKLKGSRPGNVEFNVEVAGDVFRRLHELGIEAGQEEAGERGDVMVHRHFIGKKVRVNGVIKLYPKAGGQVLHWLRIDNLDQIELVRRD